MGLAEIVTKAGFIPKSVNGRSLTTDYYSPVQWAAQISSLHFEQGIFLSEQHPVYTVLYVAQHPLAEKILQRLSHSPQIAALKAHHLAEQNLPEKTQFYMHSFKCSEAELPEVLRYFKKAFEAEFDQGEGL